MRWQILIPFSVFLLSTPIPVNADDITTKDIVNALDPHTKIKPPNRSFKRGIQIQPGTSEDNRPTVNLYINFQFDSAQLTNDGQISLETLGKALNDPRLQKYSFLIAGHTDAKGPAEYNQVLSEKRADAVKGYLVDRLHIEEARLASKGFGSRELLDRSQPEDGVNRRVQVTNVSPDN